MYVKLFEDETGHILRTRELTIYTDGRVFEERVDYLREPAHNARDLRRLTPSEVRDIERVVEEARICELAERIPTARDVVYPDAKWRSISVERAPRSCSVSYDAPYEDYGDETRRVERVWREVLRIVDE